MCKLAYIILCLEKLSNIKVRKIQLMKSINFFFTRLYNYYIDKTFYLNPIVYDILESIKRLFGKFYYSRLHDGNIKFKLNYFKLSFFWFRCKQYLTHSEFVEL